MGFIKNASKKVGAVTGVAVNTGEHLKDSVKDNVPAAKDATKKGFGNSMRAMKAAYVEVREGEEEVDSVREVIVIDKK